MTSYATGTPGSPSRKRLDAPHLAALATHGPRTSTFTLANRPQGADQRRWPTSLLPRCSGCSVANGSYRTSDNAGAALRSNCGAPNVRRNIRQGGASLAPARPVSQSRSVIAFTENRIWQRLRWTADHLVMHASNRGVAPRRPQRHAWLRSVSAAWRLRGTRRGTAHRVVPARPVPSVR